MTKKGSLNENEIDALLRNLHLEENTNAVNEREANFVLKQEYAVNIDPVKETALIKRLQSKPGGSGNIKLISSLIIIGIITVSAFYVYSGKNKPAKHNSDRNQYTIIAQNKTTRNLNAKQGKADITSLTAKTSPGKINDGAVAPAVVNSLLKIDTAVAKTKYNAGQNRSSTEKLIPVLTEKDRLKYAQIKTQMIANLIKFNKGLYTKIPAYKTDYAGKATVLDAFTIRNVGITNLEYKTFLADLLTQNRSDDYLKCRVLNENWAKQGYCNLADSYFKEAKYNDFPVVNISYEGAKLFCKWLEDEIKFYMQQNNMRSKLLQVRLPYDEEWVYAAREGYAKIAFEKGYNTIFDESAGLVNKSFTNRVELVKRRVERVDTLYSFYATNRYGWTEKEITDFFEIGLNYYKSGTLDTIYSNRMKVLGKIGRVSEMIPQKRTARVWLSGLSWKNKEEYQKLENEFKANTASPFVGFRIVVIDPNDPEYKKPFW